jgi:hypothetical protein
MNIYQIFEAGNKMGLKDFDVYPYNNPQRLNMKELNQRICDIEESKCNDGFMGGTWSGD